MTVLFWYISISAFSNFTVSVVHDFIQETFLIFFLILFSVLEFAGLKNIFMSNVHCPYIKKNLHIMFR